MKYISAEEFLKQPKEIQKVFLDWWQPEEFDIYVNKELEKHRVTQTDLEDDVCNYYLKTEYIPLFTEGQLREFIEDKTSELAKAQCRMKIEYKTKDEIEENKRGLNLIPLQSQEGYFIQITSTEFMGGIMKFHDLGTDLLKAYWQVACKIAYGCSELKIEEELKILKHRIEILKNGIKNCREWEYYTEISDLLESNKERYNKLMKDYYRFKDGEE